MPRPRRRGWDVEHFADEAASGKYINGNLREVLQLLASGQGDGLSWRRSTGSRGRSSTPPTSLSAPESRLVAGRARPQSGSDDRSGR